LTPVRRARAADLALDFLPRSRGLPQLVQLVAKLGDSFD
jgi:hypothetical protein